MLTHLIFWESHDCNGELLYAFCPILTDYLIFNRF